MPNGFTFYVPATKWKPRRFASFDTIVNALIAHRKGNPHLTDKFKWSTDYATVANEVDEFNATVCQRMGWTNYITTTDGGQSAPIPFPPPSSNLPQSFGQLAAGVASISEMFGPEGPIKDQNLAESRADTCVKCPLNEQGDWLSYFTVPTASLIRRALGWLKEQRLQTSSDEKLNICQACSCPCRLKVWARLDHIIKHMPKESSDALHESCWIRSERSRA